MGFFNLKHIKHLFARKKWMKEAIVFLLFGLLYKTSRYIAIGDVETAFSNAIKVIAIEKNMGFFWEQTIQAIFLKHTTLIKVLNTFYLYVHIPATLLFFIWLFKRYNHKYRLVRNGFIAANCVALVFFIVYPCAPPRMLSQYGFSDTLLDISGVNLYSGVYSGVLNQYAAVPSMHFGNAFLIAVVVFIYAKDSYLKYGIMLYPLFVLLVIVITGNHFFIDAIIGGCIVILPYFFMKQGNNPSLSVV
jgi:hypothetical protein